MAAGNYILRLINLTCQVLQVKEIVYEGGNSSQKIVLPFYIAKGMVRLEAVHPGKVTITRIKVGTYQQI